MALRLLGALVFVLSACAAEAGPFQRGTTGSDARYGAAVGASAHWAPAYVPAASTSAQAGFGGNVALSCSGVDFNGFVQRFNPEELLTQMKTTLVSGAQAAVANYMIMLAYSNPTIASVLDMMDKKYTARFNAFSQACNAQQAKRQGAELGAKRMADVEDQCFSAEIGKGTSPTDAYRVCANAATFGALDLPGMKRTDEFLKRYTSVDVSKQMGALLNLLPDEEVGSGGLKMKPASTTTMQMYGNIEARARNAITAVLEGQDPAKIAECGDQDILGKSNASTACLPATAASVVNSPSFLSARMLSPAAAELYVSAMSSQVATTAMYSNIYELKQQISQMDVKESSGVTATEVLRRRETMLKEVARLEAEADALRKVQESRSRLAKTQILTLQKTQQGLEDSARRANDRSSNSTGRFSFMRIFGKGGNE